MGSSRSRIQFQHPALSFHGDDSLLKRREQLPGVGDSAHVEVGAGVIVGEDFDGADAQYSFKERLMEFEVFDVPEFHGVDGGAEPAALEVDAVIGDAVARAFDGEDRHDHQDDADDDQGDREPPDHGMGFEQGGVEKRDEDDGDSEDPIQGDLAQVAAQLRGSFVIDFLGVAGGAVDGVIDDCGGLNLGQRGDLAHKVFPLRGRSACFFSGKAWACSPCRESTHLDSI